MTIWIIIKVLFSIELAISFIKNPTTCQCSTILNCNPIIAARFNRSIFLKEQWAQSRKELGLVDFESNITKKIKNEKIFLKYYKNNNYSNKTSLLQPNNLDKSYDKVKLFYNEISWNGLMVYNCNNTIIPYLRIFKCSSQGISINLGNLKCIDNKYGEVSLETYNSQEQFDKQLNINNNNNNNSNKPVRVFTFVRDPFEHFLSGFSESVWHSLSLQTNRNNNYNIRQENKKLNVNDVKAIINELLQVNSTNRLWPLEKGFQHLFPMSNVFFKFNINILGYLESFENDWNSKIKTYYNLSQPYIKSFGQHPTSTNHPSAKLDYDYKSNVINNDNSNNNNNNKEQRNSDPNNARTSLLQLFKIDKKYKIVICRLVIIDYICLPNYSLPKECQNLNETVQKYRSMLSRIET